MLVAAILIALVPAGCMSPGIDTPQYWVKTFGGTNDDCGYSVQQTSDRGYIIAGTTGSYGGGYDGAAWLIKTDANGNKAWDKTFGGTGYYYSDCGYSVQQTADRGYIVAGTTGSYGGGYYGAAWLIKTDANGNTLWDKAFADSGYADYGYSVQQASDGGYIIAGGKSSYSPSYVSTAWLIKTDAAGHKVWDKTFGGTIQGAGCCGYSVQQTSDGGYIIAGSANSYSGHADVWLIKTDSNGGKVWDKVFTGTGSAYGKSVLQTTDSGYIIAVGTSSYSSGNADAWLIKTDAQGNKVWDNTFGGTDAGRANSVQQTADGGYIVAGNTYSQGAGGSDIWLIKTNVDGNKIWERTFGGARDEVGYSVQQTSDGEYVIVGSTNSCGAGASDVLLVKTKGLGDTLPPTASTQ